MATLSEILASEDPTDAIASAFNGISDLLLSILLELRWMREYIDTLE